MLGESGCGKSVTGYSILYLVNSPGRIVEGEILYHRSQDEVINLLAYDPRGEGIRQI
jgi:ABC-type dipeptide/oligopeptide/nickel transport system ATPase component